MLNFKFLLPIAGFAIAAYTLICLSLVIWQNRLIFAPSSTISTTPADLGLSYEDVYIPVSTATGRIERFHGWWIPSDSSRGVVLYLHGNGLNVSANVEHARRFQTLGFSVLLIDYRGYGKSEGGFPTETQVYEDAEAAWQYLIQERQISPQDILVYGHSLGGAIAVNLASRHPEIAGLIIEGTFTSMGDMVKHQEYYNIFPIDWILTHKFDSLAKITSLSMPILVIHGTEDTVVPPLMSEILYDAITAPKQLLLVPNAHHTNVASMSGETYLQAVQDFYSKVQSYSAQHTSLQHN